MNILIIKCNLMLPFDIIREVRKSVLMQMEDGVVVLPYGFELATVDVILLEKLRSELHETAEMHIDGGYYLRDEWIDEYIDKYIKELKDNE